MGYIYKITNKVNGKMYIGQTKTSIEERMRKHYSDAKWEKGVTGVDAAIRKYGEDNFQVDIICECDNEELNDLEVFYIEKYDTFNTPKGYNLTPGGQSGYSGLNLNSNDVIQKYQELGYVNKTAEFFGCSEKAISKVLHQNNIEIIKHFPTCGKIENILGKGKQFKDGDNVKPVRIIELDKTFSSLKECSQWLIDNGYSKAKSMEMARKSLSRCLTGERKTYCKLHFEYL